MASREAIRVGARFVSVIGQRSSRRGARGATWFAESEARERGSAAKQCCDEPVKVPAVDQGVAGEVAVEDVAGRIGVAVLVGDCTDKTPGVWPRESRRQRSADSSG